MSVIGKTLAIVRHPILVFRLWRKARKRPCTHRRWDTHMPKNVDTWVRECRCCGHVQMLAPSLQWVDCGLAPRHVKAD